MAKASVQKNPPHAAKKCSTNSKVKEVHFSRGKKQDTEDEEEDDSVDTSGSENTDSESERSKADVFKATSEEEDAEGSESESKDDAASEEVEAEGFESESAQDVEIGEESNKANEGKLSMVEVSHAVAADLVSEEAEDSDFYDDAEVNEEDKKEIMCVTLLGTNVLEFEEQCTTSKKNYARLFKVLAIPKLGKHPTQQQKMDIVQCLGKKVDPMNKSKPTVKERSFMYLQELVFLFARKEKKIQEESASESEEDEDGDKSPKKQRGRKEKLKKNTQAVGKYLFHYLYDSYTVFLQLVFWFFFAVLFPFNFS
jgi:hypothetical protein